MPRSKHRRKAGGKAIKHPGRKKAPRDWSRHLCADDKAYRALRSRYLGEITGDFDGDKGFLIDLILDQTFDFKGERVELLPASKAIIFDRFTAPRHLELEDVPEPDFTVEEGEAILAFLLEHDMIEVDGDQITLPARFASDQPESAQVEDAIPEVY